jgi:hypothetical protein
MFIILISLTFAALVVAVFAAHVWAANMIVDRLWPKEDMAKTIQPKSRSEARSIPPAVDHPTARPGVSAPSARLAPEVPGNSVARA